MKCEHTQAWRQFCTQVARWSCRTATVLADIGRHGPTSANVGRWIGPQLSWPTLADQSAYISANVGRSPGQTISPDTWADCSRGRPTCWCSDVLGWALLALLACAVGVWCPAAFWLLLAVRLLLLPLLRPCPRVMLIHAHTLSPRASDTKQNSVGIALPCTCLCQKTIRLLWLHRSNSLQKSTINACLPTQLRILLLGAHTLNPRRNLFHCP